MPRRRVAIIVTFLGPAPFWMSAFLQSCRRNPDVQWLIYCDFPEPPATPENVAFLPLDLREFNERASDATRTAIAITPASMRKMCDLKPAYGLMFADALRPFEWWAYSDLDIIWGDLGRFVSAEMLDHYNIISSRQRKIGGHLALFRNTDAVNRTFEQIPNIAGELAEPTCRRIDENLFTFYLRDLIARSSFKARPRVYWEQEMTISAQYQKALLDGELRNLEWRDGRAFDADGRECAYLHFHKLKVAMRTIDFGDESRPEAFVINRDGIFATVQGKGRPAAALPLSSPR